VKSRIINVVGKNIKAKLAFVLIIIASLCFGFIMFAESLFEDLKKQKEQYLHSTEILLEINNLVSQFYNIQESGNLFLVQKDLHYLYLYQADIDTFQKKLEFVVQFLYYEDENNFLNDITFLLQEKKVMLRKLQNLFANKKEIDSLYKKIADKIDEEINREMPQIIETNRTTMCDTVWQEPKTFRQRLKDAFRSSKKRGKEIASINTLIITDTSIQETILVTPLLDSLQELTQRYQHQYTTKIERIEIELYALLTADQYITKKITALLLQLHKDMLFNVISLSDEYENNTQLTLTRSIFTGAIALLLIILFIVFIFKNIKTIRKVHEALKLEKQKTEELMESRHQLLLAISHDIKTPLNALLGYLELWENELLSPNQLRELNTMQYSGKYILSLLNNLLEFTRLEQHKSQITTECIEIVPFFMEIMEMFNPLCNEKNNSLTYNINVEENPQILTDSLKLKQIVVNLISNAVKYTSNGNVNVDVDVLNRESLQLSVIISDSGRGIPKEKLATLFEPFTRVKKNSTGIEGSGLGLFVVKGLLDLMKGNIVIQTEENQGTKISFLIPCENILENKQFAVSKQESLKIWVIEDDRTQVLIIASMLHKLGHTTITTSTKEEFENQYQTESTKCNLIFTDLQMGDLTGYEVLKKIRSVSDVPIVCLTGNSLISKNEFQQIGFADFLEKPFTLNQLEKIMTSIKQQNSIVASNLFSLHTLIEMFDNDMDTIFTVLNTFAASLPNDIKKFEYALEDKNLFLIQQTAHRILPFCKQVNASEVVPILEKIELSKKQHQIHFNDLKSDTILLVENLKRLLTDVLLLLKQG
jgi:signal transduction histidine kinase/CheY-like chemotaxis protein